MKAKKVMTTLAILLIGLVFATNADARDLKNRRKEKKSVTLTVDKPIIDFVSKAYADDLNASDIVRAHKILSQVDHVTVSFRDPETPDYVLFFKELDNQQLEQWMFDAGYLENEPVISQLEPWMFESEYLKGE